ncbi:MAG: alpha/beta fold hydrolase [Sphingobacteriaceae bacterium]|nr:alpha/beta fold hydrolase [Sphingobacteriaceae bacterium]
MNQTLKTITALAIIAIILGCKHKPDGRTTEKDSYLYSDVPSDKLFPANIVELQFNSGGSTIYGFEYVANGKGPHPTVVLLHATPGNERNLDIAQSLRRAGYNIFYFNYRGAWGSQGTFSYKNSIEDVRNVLDYICDAKNLASLRVDTSKIFLVGHNLGSGVGLIEGLHDKRVKGVAALSLFNPYATFKGREAVLNFSDIKAYLSTLKMLNCDPQLYLMDIINNLDNYNIEKMIASSSKPILVIDEQKNNDYLSQFNKKKKDFDYEVWDTDIEFSNSRIALTKRLKKWLDTYKD